MVSDGQIILPSWGNAVRSVLLSGLGRITRRGQIIVGAAPLETMVLDPPPVVDSPGVLHMTAAGEASYFPLADIKPGPDSITAVELAPGSVGAVELQDDAVTRPALADAAVGTAEVVGGAITAPKLSAGVRESLANVEPYARPTMPAALIPITRIDTRSIYLAGEGPLPTAAGTSDGDILIRIGSQRSGIGLPPRFTADWTYDTPSALDAVGIGDTAYAVRGDSPGTLYSLTATGQASAVPIDAYAFGVTTVDGGATLVTMHNRYNGSVNVQDIYRRELDGSRIGSRATLARDWTDQFNAGAITYDDGHFYVPSGGFSSGVQPDKIRAWNATTYARVPARDFSTIGGARPFDGGGWSFFYSGEWGLAGLDHGARSRAQPRFLRRCVQRDGRS